ncbi:glycosyltransferase family 8 protein [Pseudomonas japonica]|uniref:glycosyltransferase family 8 protein n=1 Tax=Pseudomonas japonica TaxID=256466 RepID=UPI0015E4806C|nr:glycosyltransferase [Pseudomonas japonica]MBA1244169.1 hypothetical protein [Pseudomonas japonica]
MRSTAQPRHVVFGVDSAYCPHAWVTLLSVIRHEPPASCHFHFITSDELGPFFDGIASFVNELCCSISLHKVELDVFATLPACQIFPPSIYLRLLAPYVLKDVQQALYLDADVVCLRPLIELWAALEGTCAVAAVADDTPVAAVERIDALGLQARRYFNSGVLFMHLERWRDSCVTEQVLACVGEWQHALKYPDQDALNIVLQGRIKYIDPKFNTQLQLGRQRTELSPDTVLLHYTGVDKPWQAWNDQPAAKYYREVREQLPWHDRPYDVPHTARQLKRMQKSRMRQGRIASGLFWMIKRGFRKFVTQ